jgi:hypothetical protein
MSVLIQGPRAVRGFVQLAEATVCRTCSLTHRSQNADICNKHKQRLKYATQPNALHPR